jgi:hypothetical protein
MPRQFFIKKPEDLMDRLCGRPVRAPMDVLIMERDELMATMLADTLAVAGISAAVLADEEALRLPLDQPPQLVITGMNRTHDEDLTGLMLISVLRRKWPRLRAIYLATLWPVRLSRQALTARERFLSKPVGLGTIIDTVRELLRPIALDARETGCMQSDKPAPEEPPPEAPEPVLPDPLDDEPAPRPVPPRAPPDPIVAVCNRRRRATRQVAGNR